MTPTRTTADTPSGLTPTLHVPAAVTTPEPAPQAENSPRPESRRSSPYFTTDEAAEYLRTTRGTVYNLVWRGILPRRRGKLLFTRQELDDYLAGKKPTPKPRRSTTPRGSASHRA
jgi:excisionase family DNA binding protein